MEVPQRGPGAEPGGIWGKAPISWRHSVKKTLRFCFLYVDIMYGINLSKATCSDAYVRSVTDANAIIQ